MKITGINTFIRHAYCTNWVFVKVLAEPGTRAGTLNGGSAEASPSHHLSSTTFRNMN